MSEGAGARAGPVRHVHCVAVGGTGMGSLAGLLRGRGLRVTGSDGPLYPPMSTFLERWGVEVREGFRAEHVLEPRPDLVVVGNAVRPENPEARAAFEAGLRVLSFPDALYELAIRGRHSVVVAGTHGKTTTTSLLAHLLFALGRDPSFLAGGIAANFDGSFREGEGPEFVVEGDEYDTAFFDKTPKFLHYHPETLILTSVEFDHADIYRDLEQVKEAFRRLVRGMPSEGTVVAAVGEPNVAEVVAEAPCRVLGYAVEEGPGDGTEAALRARALRSGPEGTRFELWQGAECSFEARLPQFGRHNVANALAALGACAARGLPLAEAAAALPAFRGVKRRQELRGEAAGVTLLDDFAHHPTAVRETLAALRAAYPGRRLVALFEPRSNTSRRALFQEEYAEALAAADRVLAAPPPEGAIYSAFGEVRERFSSERLAEALRARGVDAAAPGGTEALVEAFVAGARPGDVAVTLSNGDFGGIWERLLARLAERERGDAAPAARSNR